MAVPCRSIEDQKRARGTARQHLPFVIGSKISQAVRWRAGPSVRARQETGRAVVGPKVINHQDEAEERPVGGISPNIYVQVLGRRVGPQRPRVKRTQLERPADDTAARLEQGRKYVEVVECRSTIDEIIHPRLSVPNPDVVTRRGCDGIGVRIGQPFHPIGRHGIAEDDETPLPQLGGGVHGEFAPCGQRAEPVRHPKRAV